ncbi:phosphoenolpyruvate--protein phosphotransferase [bacterium]|nr:phosphoenolpyruvate--protein phosphotransferase [bacterium]
MRVVTGIAASPGFAVAPVHHIAREAPEVVRRDVGPEAVESELARLDAAIEKAHGQIGALIERLAKDLGPEESAIMESHLLILEDELIVGRAREVVRDEAVNCEAALKKAVDEIISQFRTLEDDYFRERMQDLRDVENRLLRILTGSEDVPVAGPAVPSVVTAMDLAPSDTAAMGPRNVLAFVLGDGSTTSHVAILARSLGVPAVVGIGPDVMHLADGDLLAVDGDRGEVIVEPDTGTVARFRELAQRASNVVAKLSHLKDQPAVTPDGRTVKMMANIELPVEVDKALDCGAEGIGLLRTEYIYFQHRTIPDEEEQLAVYGDILARMDGRPVLFRTLDVGGDKVQRYLGARKESNPFLGWRGIRFLLANRLLFKSQLRAIYRAAALGPARLMFPMITGLAELREAREICRECCEELAREGLDHDPGIEIGIMIETPAAAMVAELLARECDFFSVGTNDLIQYTLAMDRLNSRVSYLYQPLHPGVLRLLRATIRAAHEAGIWVGICGEMSSETRYAEVLLGLGFDEVSLHAAQLPKVKQVIRWTPMQEAEGLVGELGACETAADADALLARYLEEKKAKRKAETRKELERG